MIMANSQIFQDENTCIRVSLNHKCFILASLLVIQSQAIPVQKFKHIVTTSPYSNFTFTYSFGYRINYDASNDHKIKKVLSNETIKYCNRAKEHITNYNGLNNLSNKCISSDAHVTRVNISDKHSNKQREIKNKLSNKTEMNYSKSEEYIKNYSGLIKDLNNKCTRSDVHGTKVIKSDEHRKICYGTNECRKKYSEDDECSSKCTSSDKLYSNHNLSKQTPYMTSINDSEELTLLTRKIYGNVLNATSYYSSLLNNNTNCLQSYEKKVTKNNRNKIPYDILKKYIYYYIQMKIKSIIAHTKFKNERESRQNELNRNSGLMCGVNNRRNVKRPDGLKELKTMSGNNKNKKKRFVIGTKSYSNTDVYIDTSNNSELNSGNGSSYRKIQDLDHINNSSLKGNLFGKKTLATSCLIYSTSDYYEAFKITSDSPSKDRTFISKHTSKYCSASPKIESSTLKPIAMREVDKIHLDTNFDEAESLQVDELMNMDDPELLTLVKSLIEREINNNLEDVKVYNDDSGYGRSKIIPSGYRAYHRANTNSWFREDTSEDTPGDTTENNDLDHSDPEKGDGDSPENGHTDSFEPVDEGSTVDFGQDVRGTTLDVLTQDVPTQDVPTQDVPTQHEEIHEDTTREGVPNQAEPERGSDGYIPRGCYSGLCKKTAMALVITFFATIGGVLVLVFMIFYLKKRCCKPKSQMMHARPC